MFMKPGLVFIFLVSCCLLVFSCKKTGIDQPEPPAGYKLSYSDTIFYVGQATTASPSIPLDGKYEAHPDNLNINNNTGVITLSLNGKDGECQTGLRYRITYTSPNGEKHVTYVVLAGMNYQDGIAYENSPYIYPVFNARPGLPNPGGTFSSEDDDLVIEASTGKIDLKQSIQNGIFGGNPQSDKWDIVNVKYSTNYNGVSVTHNINLLIYLYSSLAVIPRNVGEVMNAHQPLLHGLSPSSFPVNNVPDDTGIDNKVFANKPRPPCIILIGN